MEMVRKRRMELEERLKKMGGGQAGGVAQQERVEVPTIGSESTTGPSQLAPGLADLPHEGQA